MATLQRSSNPTASLYFEVILDERNTQTAALFIDADNVGLTAIPRILQILMIE